MLESEPVLSLRTRAEELFDVSDARRERAFSKATSWTRRASAPGESTSSWTVGLEAGSEARLEARRRTSSTTSVGDASADRSRLVRPPDSDRLTLTSESDGVCVAAAFAAGCCLSGTGVAGSTSGGGEGDREAAIATTPSRRAWLLSSSHGDARAVGDVERVEGACCGQIINRRPRLQMGLSQGSRANERAGRKKGGQRSCGDGQRTLQWRKRTTEKSSVVEFGVRAVLRGILGGEKDERRRPIRWLLINAAVVREGCQGCGLAFPLSRCPTASNP
jgi:hypothetical protein